MPLGSALHASLYMGGGGAGGSSSGYNIANATLVTTTDLTSRLGSAGAIRFNNDGTKMFIFGYNSTTNKPVLEYGLSTAYATSSATYTRSFNTNSQLNSSGDNVPSGLAFGNSGAKMYVSDTWLSKIFQYSVATAYNLTTVTYDTKSFTVSDCYGITFNTDGTRMYVSRLDVITQYTLTTAWDVSTAGSAVNYTPTQYAGPYRDLTFSNDGKKLFVLAGNDYKAFQINLSTAYNLSTASATTISSSFTLVTPNGIEFNSDGTKVYIVQIDGANAVKEYSLA